MSPFFYLKAAAQRAPSAAAPGLLDAQACSLLGRVLLLVLLHVPCQFASCNGVWLDCLLQP
jgi:hypothetical protein